MKVVVATEEQETGVLYNNIRQALDMKEYSYTSNSSNEISFRKNYKTPQNSRSLERVKFLNEGKILIQPLGNKLKVEAHIKNGKNLFTCAVSLAIVASIFYNYNAVPTPILVLFIVIIIGIIYFIQMSEAKRFINTLIHGDYWE